jgi:CheY-like chemotaxis protein
MFLFHSVNKGLHFGFQKTTPVPEFVRADETKLRQVLINLINNAIKFTSTGHVIVKIAYSNQNSTCYINVEDTGIGISPEEMDLLFQPFVQTRSGRQKTEGTGLGLPISKKFVELMGGNISVESRYGKGSIFKFHIPAPISEECNIRFCLPEQRVIGLEQGQPVFRILVVEDNEDNRILVCGLLKDTGFEVCCAENGISALSLKDTWFPHLILMDIRMPGMDGYETIRRIRQQEREKDRDGVSSHVPIVAFTAYAFDEDRAKALDSGCDDFIRKPFTESDLFETIARHLPVRYRYEKKEKPDQPLFLRLDPSDLKNFSLEWIAGVRHAAQRGKSETLLELIEEVRPDHGNIADILTGLVRAYQFKTIVDALPTKEKDYV